MENKINISDNCVMVCHEIRQTVIEWESASSEISRMKNLMGSQDGMPDSDEVLKYVCVELKKLLEGETRIRNKA